MDKITSFNGKYRFLSNFWPAEVTYGDMTFPTVEHAYQAAKTVDMEIRRQILKDPNPGRAKRIGKHVELRANWDNIRLNIMEGLVRQKFKIPELRALLLATNDAELIEGNTWNDRFWGVCRGVGENNLGKILMKVREECRI